MKIKIDPKLAPVLDRKLATEVIRTAVPAGVARYVVEFLPARSVHYCGRAYPGARRVLVRVPLSFRAKLVRPYRFVGTPGSSGYQGNEVYSHFEALLYLVAHELRHLWQTRVPRGWRVWGARGRYSERDADCYALGVVRRWRRRST